MTSRNDRPHSGEEDPLADDPNGPEDLQRRVRELEEELAACRANSEKQIETITV